MVRRKTIVGIAAIAVVLLLMLAALTTNIFFEEKRSISDRNQVSFDNVVYDVIIADTPASRKQGLSNHPGLQENEGMLFVFEDSAVRQFWMKEMLFPLDIVWINEEKKVEGIVENALPESYPDAFSSVVPVRYVLELNAGDTQKHNITIGDHANF